MESTSPSPRMKFAVRSGTGVRLLALSRRLWKNTLGRKKCINQKLIGERSHEPDRKSTRLNSSHTVIYSLSLHDALPIWNRRSVAGLIPPLVEEYIRKEKVYQSEAHRGAQS